MIAISQIDSEMKFRKDMFKSKRKPEEEIWSGDPIKGVTDIVRFHYSRELYDDYGYDDEKTLAAIYTIHSKDNSSLKEEQ